MTTCGPYPISKEDYDKALEHGAESIVGDHIKMGYGLYSAKVDEFEGNYYLTYTRGDSCD